MRFTGYSAARACTHLHPHPHMHTHSLDALHEFQRSQDAPRSIVLMRVAWQAKSADAHKALFIAAELHEGAVPPVHHVLHALHDELHSSHLRCKDIISRKGHLSQSAHTKEDAEAGSRVKLGLSIPGGQIKRRLNRKKRPSVSFSCHATSCLSSG
eukprot:scaffold293568_cov22-Tisochrysis_lutea.AAC.1